MLSAFLFRMVWVGGAGFLWLSGSPLSPSFLWSCILKPGLVRSAAEGRLLLWEKLRHTTLRLLRCYLAISSLRFGFVFQDDRGKECSTFKAGRYPNRNRSHYRLCCAWVSVCVTVGVLAKYYWSVSDPSKPCYPIVVQYVKSVNNVSQWCQLKWTIQIWILDFT